jgi:hypothetical protein
MECDYVLDVGAGKPKVIFIFLCPRHSFNELGVYEHPLSNINTPFVNLDRPKRHL